MQSEFIDYQRQEALAQGVCLLIVLFFLTMVSFSALALSTSDSSDFIPLLVVHFTIPTILLTLTLLIGAFRRNWAELLGLSLMMPTVVIICLTYLAQIFEADILLRQ